MMNTLRPIVIVFAPIVALSLSVACHHPGPAETAGRKVDNAASDVKDAAKDTKNDVKKDLKK